jgi:transposase
VQLARTFGCMRYVYNWALAMKQDALRQRTEKVSYAETEPATYRAQAARGDGVAKRSIQRAA